MKMFVMEIAEQKLIGNIYTAKKMISLISNIDENERFIQLAFELSVLWLENCDDFRKLEFTLFKSFIHLN